MFYLGDKNIKFKTFKQADDLALQLLNLKNKTLESIDLSTVSSTRLKGSAFRDFNRLTNVILPPNLEEIPPYCFAFCSSLESIEIPNSVKNIGNQSFQSTKLQHIEISSNVELIGSGAFSLCNSLETIILNEGLTSIGGWCFSNSPNITCKVKNQDYTFPKSLKSLSLGTFNNTNIEEIIIPEGNLEALPSSFCSNCTNLKRVEIPSTIKTIYSNAFSGCDGITINIDKPTDSISGAPWGATNATVNWLAREFFKFTVNSGSDATFAIPVMNDQAVKEDGSTSYSWIIDWGDGTTEESSGVASSSTTIPHTYSSANTEYQITIRPKNQNELGWGKGFGFRDGVGAKNGAEMISLDSPITKNMWLDNGNNDYLGYYMFWNCRSLTMNDIFNLPQNLTSVGINFCCRMFQFCRSLTMNDIFNLPQNLTSVGNIFCLYMFHGCSNLTMNNIFTLPQRLTSVGNGFCESMFSDSPKVNMGEEFNLPQRLTSVGVAFCYQMFGYGGSGSIRNTTLTMNNIFNLPQRLTSVGSVFCYQMFYQCTNLTMNNIFQLPQNITSVGISFCDSMFHSCNNLTMNNIFTLPQNLTSVNNGFCNQMFYHCTSLTTGVHRFFDNLVLPQSELNKGGVYIFTFNNCSSITEEISANTIPQLYIIPTENNYCFSECPADKITNCPKNWGGNLAPSTKNLYGWKSNTSGVNDNVYTDTTTPNSSSVIYESDGSKASYTYKSLSENTLTLSVSGGYFATNVDFIRDTSLDKSVTGYFTS